MDREEAIMHEGHVAESHKAEYMGRADTRTQAERDHAETLDRNLQVAKARNGGSILDEEERRRTRAMNEKVDRLIHSRSERQRERGFRLMDRIDAIIHHAWHRAATYG